MRLVSQAQKIAPPSGNGKTKFMEVNSEVSGPQDLEGGYLPSTGNPDTQQPLPTGTLTYGSEGTQKDSSIPRESPPQDATQLGDQTAIMTPPKTMLKLDDRLSPKPDIAKEDHPQASLVQEGESEGSESSSDDSEAATVGCRYLPGLEASVTRGGRNKRGALVKRGGRGHPCRITLSH